MSSGGYSGGFGQQPSFGGFGGFGQSPQYGGYGVPQQPQFGGFGGFGGGFGMPQPQYGGFQQPQYGGFDDRFGGGFDRGFGQRGPGNAYARPFPGLQPQPAPPPQQLTPPPGMELNPDYRPRDVAPGMFTTMEIRPNENRFRPIQAERAVMPETPTGGGYPSRDQFNQTFQVMPAVMPEVPTGGGYPSRDQFYSQVIQPTMIEATPAQQNTSYVPSAEKQQVDEIMKRSYNNPSSITAEDRAVLQRWDDGASARNAQDMQAQMQAFRQQQQLAGGLGGTYGGYQALPYGGYQPMGGYRMFQF